MRSKRLQHTKVVGFCEGEEESFREELEGDERGEEANAQGQE